MMSDLRLILALCSLVGCAPTSVRRVEFTLDNNPHRLSCEVVEARPSMLSTLTVGTCQDKDGKPLGLVGGAGMSAAGLALGIAQTGAMIAVPIIGATIVSGALKQIDTGTDIVVPGGVP